MTAKSTSVRAKCRKASAVVTSKKVGCEEVRVAGGEKTHPLSYDTCESCGGTFLESEFKDATDFKGAQEEIVEFFKQFSQKTRRRGAAAASPGR